MEGQESLLYVGVDCSSDNPLYSIEQNPPTQLDFLNHRNVRTAPHATAW